MKVLVVGSGGREHVICWKLKQSSRVTELYCLPGNAGIASIADCVPIAATDMEGIVEFSRNEKMDLVFVAPEDPLAKGLVNRLQNEGIRAFGPRAEAAYIEASKAYSKDMMKRYEIPTADYAVFDDMELATKYLEIQKFPIVIKADGLALGKGVIIADTMKEAVSTLRSMFSDKAFGSAGDKVVIEEFLKGPELTILAFSDGKTVLPMISSRDHKRAYDYDRGKNTGGMGAITPGAVLTLEEEKIINEKIISKTIQALEMEGRPFSGVIYFGLMLTADGPKVIEYNARFGDPEAQAVLPRLQNDFLEIIDACIDGTLDQITLQFKPGSSCCVVMASGGYPEKYKKGYEITGIENVEGLVFQAGTARIGEKLVTNGGRVLCVYADADTLEEAIDKAYEDVAKIQFADMHFRSDIGRTENKR